jgi:putative ABC transport system permease protein
MATFLSDLHHGLRVLLASPRVTLVAVLSLALGIGATTAIFTVVNAVILRPLPYPDPNRLVMVWETAPDNNRRWVAPANFLDWRRDATSFAQLAAYDRYSLNMTRVSSRPERLRAASVSGNFFSTLGVRPILGRVFTSAEDAPRAGRAVLLSYGVWQRLFGSASDVIGQTLTLDNKLHVIAGVLPQSFDLLGADLEIVTSGDRGVPDTFPFPTDVTQVRDSHLIYVIGRLNDGVTIQQAQAEMSTIMRTLERLHPDTNTGLGARVVSLHEDVIAASRRALLLLFAAVGFLLLIACVNVANLLLLRAVARQREMAIRVSLGAGRARLVRQMLTETMLIGMSGGAIGLVLAIWGVDALMALAPEGLPRAGEVRADEMTLAFTLAISLGTAALFGLAPAIHASRTDVQQTMHAGSVRTSEARPHRRVQHALVVSELTLAQVLLAGAGLLIASFVNVQNVDLGFAPDRLLAVEIAMPPGKYADPARKLAFNRSVLERLESLPGVKSAAATLTVPLRGAINRGIRIGDRPEPPPGQQPNVDFMIVSAGYFRTLGIPIVAGRAFTDHDTLDAPRVAIVSQAMARRYWPGENAIGKTVGFGRNTRVEIVGIVGDVRQRDPERAAEPLLYIPYQQDAEPWNFIAFALRTDVDPAALGAAARDAVFAVDPQQPVSRIRTLDEIADAALAPRRFNTILLGIFSALALVLAAIGTYGVMAYAVTRRTREIGVRMALGARPADVLRMVLSQGAGLVALAAGLGIAGAIATNRLLATQLFEVSPTDPATLGAGAATLVAFALLACYVPARRATRVEPLVALRDE